MGITDDLGVSFLRPNVNGINGIEIDWQSIFTLILRLLGAYVLYVVTKTFYDVYLGPLSNVPGPKLAAATRLVMMYRRIFHGEAESWLSDLHKQYGEVVRPAPGEVSFATSRAWKEIYGHAPGSKYIKMQKDPRFYGNLFVDVSLVEAGDEDHARQRKVFSHAFSERAMTEQLPMVQSYVDQFIGNLEDAYKQDKAIDMVKSFNFLTFDVMADLAFGEPLGLLKASAYTPWLDLIFSSLKVMVADVESHHMPMLRKVLEFFTPKSFIDAYETHQKNSAERVDKRLAKETDRPDIWRYVMTANHTEEGYVRQGEMHANSELFMIAGTETTATLLSGLTYYLLTNPETMKNLTKEIRSTFKTVDDINMTKLGQLSYLNACLDEALRIYPPVPVGLPRWVPQGGAELCGYNLPAKTSVYVHMLSATHSPQNFHNPDSFVPDRWSKPPPPEYANDDLATSQPFSVGPRTCIGRNLAYTEMRLSLAHMLIRFDLSLCEESKGWNKQKIFHLWEKRPLMVKIRAVDA